MSDLPWHCQKCQKRWGGNNTAHCTACCETFSVVANFDKHRQGSHVDGQRHCVPPETVGLIKSKREYPCWMMPGRE